jgi:hypothetical protein
MLDSLEVPQIAAALEEVSFKSPSKLFLNEMIKLEQQS